MDNIKKDCADVKVLCGATSQNVSLRSIFDQHVLKLVYSNLMHLINYYYYYHFYNLLLIFSDSAGTSGLNYSSIKRTLQRVKNEQFPVSPQSGNEVIEAFSNESVNKSFAFTNHKPSTLLYKGTLVDNEYTSTFFASDLIMALIDEKVELKRRRYLMDATFKIVPVGCFNQLLIIYLEYIDSVS